MHTYIIFHTYVRNKNYNYTYRSYVSYLYQSHDLSFNLDRKLQLYFVSPTACTRACVFVYVSFENEQRIQVNLKMYAAD